MSDEQEQDYRFPVQITFSDGIDQISKEERFFDITITVNVDGQSSLEGAREQALERAAEMAMNEGFQALAKNYLKYDPKGISFADGNCAWCGGGGEVAAGPPDSFGNFDPAPCPRCGDSGLEALYVPGSVRVGEPLDEISSRS
jgi:hypothetical protein